MQVYLQFPHAGSGPRSGTGMEWYGTGSGTNTQHVFLRIGTRLVQQAILRLPAGSSQAHPYHHTAQPCLSWQQLQVVQAQTCYRLRGWEVTRNPFLDFQLAAAKHSPTITQHSRGEVRSSCRTELPTQSRSWGAENVFVHVCTHVCVWNIWIDVKLLVCIFKAGEWWAFLESPLNEDTPSLLWYAIWTQIARTCISDIATGQAQNRTRPFFCYLDHYLCTSVHFRMLNSGCTISIWALFYLSHLHPGYSDAYFEEDTLVSTTSLIMFAWDSVPYRSYEGSFFV